MKDKAIQAVGFLAFVAFTLLIIAIPVKKPVYINTAATVEAGDTIYTIATRTAEQAPRSININRLAWTIQKDNGITDPGGLQPGIVLKINYKED